jgi:hypothetical protein
MKTVSLTHKTVYLNKHQNLSLDSGKILLLNIDCEEVEEDGALEFQATYGKEIERL